MTGRQLGHALHPHLRSLNSIPDPGKMFLVSYQVDRSGGEHPIRDIVRPRPYLTADRPQSPSPFDHSNWRRSARNQFIDSIDAQIIRYMQPENLISMPISGCYSINKFGAPNLPLKRAI